MTVADDTIRSDVSNPMGDSEADDGFGAFLSSLDDEDPKKPGTPSDQDEGAQDEHAAETHEGSEEDKTEQAEDGSEDTEDPDDTEIEIKVGEETKKAKLSELKRLYGQEAALTQKSQKASETLRAAEAQTAKNATATKVLLDRAQERFKPYSDLNNPASWALLAQQLSPQDYQQLQVEVSAAEADVKFLSQELDGYMRGQQEKQQQAYAEAARVCITELADPEKGLKGWGQPLYNEMMDFAVSHGVQDARQVTNAGVIRLLHMAMQFAKGQAAAKAAQIKVTKAVEKPTRTLKPGAAKQSASGSDLRQAMKSLRDSGGDLDSAADAFAASF